MALTVIVMQMFSNTDLKYKNISSIELLKIVVATLNKKKFKIVNTDITIVAEKPKIYPYIEKMKEILSVNLKINKEQIAIKATTNEKIGFIGRGEGICSMAVALIEK